jgi:hypothetical protein
MMEDLYSVRRAFIEWMTALDVDVAEQAQVIFKNKLGLCSSPDCFEEAHITLNHRKWCKHHYDKISGEAN